VLAPLVFVPGYLLPMFPAKSAFSWSLGTYWRAHRLLGLRLFQARVNIYICVSVCIRKHITHTHHTHTRTQIFPSRGASAPTGARTACSDYGFSRRAWIYMYVNWETEYTSFTHTHTFLFLVEPGRLLARAPFARSSAFSGAREYIYVCLYVYTETYYTHTSYTHTHTDISFSWSLGTYWRAHRLLGLRLFQARVDIYVYMYVCKLGNRIHIIHTHTHIFFSRGASAPTGARTVCSVFGLFRRA